MDACSYEDAVMPGKDKVTQLVVTGSSAGGIEALTELLSSLPRDFPAPIVIAQHLDPKAKTALGDILAKHTDLPIHIVMSSEPLRQATVYVIPNNRNVKISDHEVMVEAGSDGAQPSINLLFSSAAESFEEGVIAIVLSGMGSDGAVGARSVKRHGGTVIVQDPKTALFPSMPQSLPPTSVDIVARLDSMGPLLRDLLAGTYTPNEPAERVALRSLLAQIRDEVGLDFSNYKMPTIVRRLSRLMAATRCQSLTEYIAYLKQHPEEYQRLISSFLIKVTEFFRDPALFATLREKVLPQLIDYAAKNSHELRLWSAGCATGEEAYSLAITLAELLDKRKDAPNVRIFATDLDDQAIAFARQGLYAADAVQSVPEHLLERYFVHTDGSYIINKHIRAMTVFGQHDLAQRAPFPRIDLALCRNVLIYFTKELQQRALHLFAYSLRGEGYLVLGKSEATTPLATYFEPVDNRLKIYRRRGDRVTLPLADTQAPYVAPGRRSPLHPQTYTPPEARTHRQNANEVLGELLLRASVGLVVVDRHYDIQVINDAARDLLNIRTVGVGEDLVHLVSAVPSAELRALIDVAFRPNGAKPAPREFRLTSAGGGGLSRYVRIGAYSIILDGDKARNAVLILHDETDSTTSRIKAQEEIGQLQEQLGGLGRQYQELQSEHRELLTANQELMEANVQLRDNNERLLLNVEESQSSAEEIETLNEEMQATNEELETLNEELQATVEELNTTNDELEARSRELEALLGIKQVEHDEVQSSREQFLHILNELPLPLIVLDQRGKLMFQNKVYQRTGGPPPNELELLDGKGGVIRMRDVVDDSGENRTVWFATLGNKKTKKRFRVMRHALPAVAGDTPATLLTFFEA
ncbi:MAG TPA: CheR family methyltransferase [Candidatus Binatus sp.]|nr:CheR family methyltransferase [Candidatus Binatus sp.]